MSVERLLDEFSSAELSEWMEFYDLEPFGPEIESWRSAVISATVANYSALNLKRRDKKIKDFMPRLNRQQTPEEMMEIMQSFLGQ